MLATKFALRYAVERMAESQIASVLRTLLVNGYVVTKADRISERVAVISVQKRDRLGGVAASSILFADAPTENIMEMLGKTAEENGAQTLVVTTAKLDQKQVPTIAPQKFYDLLGGEIRSERLMREDLPDLLDAFGHNKLYHGFKESPDDLLEDYVKEGLQFLLESRAYRYGQDRLFESLPDGLVLGRQKLNLYFDAKAYEKGFHPSADDIKRFSSYVNEFNDRYERFVGRLHSFLVVSGSFPADAKALEEKATEFYSLCSTKLCLITGKDLGHIINDVRTQCKNRSAIKWTKIFSQLLIKPGSIASELRRIKKDNIVGD